MNEASGVADAMFIGDVFGKKQKKSTRQAADSPAGVALKRPRLSYVVVATPTWLASASTMSPHASISQQQQ